MTEPMTPQREAEIRNRRLDEVTPGPWLVSEDQGGRALVYVERESAEGETCASVLLAADWASEADVQFVASARRSVPELLAELERVRGECDRYRNAWQNARTRAADGWADAAKAEAELVPLCELERRVTEQLEDFEEGLEEDPGAPAIARDMTALLARAVRGDR